jgi:hypothetical protein
MSSNFYTNLSPITLMTGFASFAGRFGEGSSAELLHLGAVVTNRTARATHSGVNDRRYHPFSFFSFFFFFVLRLFTQLNDFVVSY